MIFSVRKIMVLNIINVTYEYINMCFWFLYVTVDTHIIQMTNMMRIVITNDFYVTTHPKSTHNFIYASHRCGTIAFL